MSRSIARKLDRSDDAARDQSAAPLVDWVETQACVLGLWLDRLIEEGDPDDLITLVHRQQAWLRLMREHLSSG